MRNNNSGLALARNYLQKYQFLIKEYELVKSRNHPKYRFVKDFHQVNGTDRCNFLKYYNRFKSSDRLEDLLPQKRGPKWKSRRPFPFIEQKVVALKKARL